MLPKTWTVTTPDEPAFREWEAPDFVTAVRMIDKIAEVAEALDHHPDVHLTQYKRLRIETLSHDVGHLTTRDEKLAQAIDDALAAP